MLTRRTRRARKSRRPAGRRQRLFERLEDRNLLSITAFSSTDVPTPIPDQGTATSTIQVAESITIDDLDVSLDITHTSDADLDVFLIAPDGTRVELFTDVGGGGDHFSGTTLDDEAATSITAGTAPFSGSFRPEGSLSTLDGKDAQGVWTLELTDDKRRKTGTLNSWSIDVTSAAPSVPALSIDDVQLVEGDSGTTAFVFTVTRSGDTSGASSVDYQTADGTATAGSDYTAILPATLNFAANETSRTITVLANADTSIESDETLFVDLSNPTNATVADAQGLGTILDDDAHPIPNDPLFTDQWQLHNTGQTGGTYDADMDLPAAWSVTTGSMSTVIAVNDSGIDYTHEDLYLNIWINEGEIPAAILSSLTDSDADGVISFRDLNDPSNAAFVSDLNATGYIDAGDLLADPTWEDGVDTDGNGYLDDLVGWDFFDGDNDPMDQHFHGTQQAGRIGAVGNNGVGMAGINWNIRMMPLRVIYKQAGSPDPWAWTIEGAVSTVDYASDMGAAVSLNSFAATDPFSQDIYDAIDRARINGHLFVAPNGGSGLDLDVEPIAWANYDLDNILLGNGIDENNQLYGHPWGNETIDVSVPTRDAPDTRPNNQYASGSGMSATSGLLSGVAALVHSVHPGWGYAEIKAQIMSTVDPVAGLAGLTVTGGRVNLAAAVSASSIHVSDPSIVEGNSGTTELVFTVSRRGDTSAAVTLDWSTADGTGTDGSDYVAASGTLQFLTGETSKTISVQVIGDTTFEQDETLLVNLLLVTGNVLVADSTSQGTILNDDTASPNDIYVWDIGFNSRTRGRGGLVHDEQIVVAVRRDSDADGVAEASDAVVAGANVTVTLSGPVGGTYSGVTNSAGVFTANWIKDLPDGTYTAEVVALTHASYTWNGDLDPTANDGDIDGDGLPDEVHAIPHAASAMATDLALLAWAESNASDDDDTEPLAAQAADELALLMME